MKHYIFAAIIVVLLVAMYIGGTDALKPLKEPVWKVEAITTQDISEEPREEEVLWMAETSAAPETTELTEPEDINEEDDWKPAKEDVDIIAQVLYHECRICTKTEQSAVVWTILNRVDSELFYFPDTIKEVCTQKNQFAYRENAPVLDELRDLAEDVLIRHHKEAKGEENVGRTLPLEYTYFWGDGRHNYFRTDYRSHEYWDWSLPSPYED